jgi:D-alanine transfer protein
MKRQMLHLIPAVVAVVLFMGCLFGLTIYSRSKEARYINALAAWRVPQADVGIALQRAAFQKPDLLVVYGSSEMLEASTKYRAFSFFKSYPTGFMVMDIARPGITSLISAQSLAAVGPDLRGKKVVISFTPSMFLAREARNSSYTANFSLLHADELVLSPNLSMGLKHDFAKRMLEYPDTLYQRPLLKYELENLASDAPIDHMMYFAAWPLGELEVKVLELQDHATVLDYLWSNPASQAAPLHRATIIDWRKETRIARRDEIAHPIKSPYDFAANVSDDYMGRSSNPKRSGSQDASFTERLDGSAEWVDFDLMLQVLKELGAKPLIMSRPLNGPFLNDSGVSARGQNYYYNKLEKAVAAYHFPMMDFRQLTSDPYFSIDQYSHTSREGWVYVDQVLNAFYHGFLR